jgi:type IV pilus assembly protein PilA
MEQPQPGQKAAVSGICAAQWGQEIGKRLAEQPPPRTLSECHAGTQTGENRIRRLTCILAKSSVSNKFWREHKYRFAWMQESEHTMFCAACGNNVTEGERFCRVCGKEVGVASGAASPGAPPAFAGTPETSGKAIVSLVCGLLFFFLPSAIVAIIFGHLSLSEIRKSAGRLKGEGVAIAGLVLGYLGIVAIPFLLIIAAIAIPNLLRARMAANESSAVASVRTIVNAETMYSESHNSAGFTCSLSDLAQDRMIDAGLAGGRKSGYSFELSGCNAGADGGANVKFQVVAYPLTRNQTGTRAFCSDESAVIKVDSGGSAQNCLENGSTLQ